jgi:imidazolonepropionase-like amidohydrolase
MDETLGYREELADALDRGNLCDGVESCRRAVRLQIRRGVDVIKIGTTGGVNSRIGAGLGAQMFEDEARALVETAHLYGRKVAVHAHGADGIALALNAGADSIEHGTLMTEDEVKLLLKTGAYYVPTLSTVNGYRERLARDPDAYTPEVRAKIEWRIAITGKAFKLAHERGVKIALGTDAGVSMHGRNADELEAMVTYGMTPAEAIASATVSGAHLLGLSNEIGTIEPGKRADIIAVGGDPLADVTTLKSVVFVMHDGRIYYTGAE